MDPNIAEQTEYNISLILEPNNNNNHFVTKTSSTYNIHNKQQQNTPLIMSHHSFSCVKLTQSAIFVENPPKNYSPTPHPLHPPKKTQHMLLNCLKTAKLATDIDIITPDLLTH